MLVTRDTEVHTGCVARPRPHLACVHPTHQPVASLVALSAQPWKLVAGARSGFRGSALAPGHYDTRISVQSDKVEAGKEKEINEMNGKQSNEHTCTH